MISKFFDKAYGLKSDEETRAFYADWAASYDQDVGEGDYQQPLRCAEMLSRYVTPGNQPVIDIGCGTGLAGLALSKIGFSQIDGCDFSPEMLEHSKERGIYQRLFEADLNSPPLEAADGMYEAATCVGVFSFGHVMPKAVNEILRVLKSDSPLIIGMNDHYYDEGSLISHLEDLAVSGEVDWLSREHGDHIPGLDLQGWVLALRKL